MFSAPHMAMVMRLAALALAMMAMLSCQPQRPPLIVETPTPGLAPPTPTPLPRPAAAPTDTPVPLPTPPPEPTEPYPPPTPMGATKEVAYPEPAEVEVTQGLAITLLTLQPGADSVRVSGSTTLPAQACIQTWLYADGKLVSWWPTEQCASVRDGQWVLTFERPALSEQAPPGARYTVIAKAPEHPEAGEARLILQAFIPYHGQGN